MEKESDYSLGRLCYWRDSIFTGFSIFTNALQEVGTESNIELLSGLAFSATFITGAIIGPVWGTLADKYGRKQQI